MLSFELSAEEHELQRSISRFAAERLRPTARPCEEEGTVPQVLVDAFWDLGLAQLACPDQYGGLGLGVSAAVVAEEEVGWGDAGIAFGVPRPGSAAMVLAGVFADEHSRMPLTPDGSARTLPVLAAIGAANFTVEELANEIVVNGASGAIPAAHRIDQVLVPIELNGDVALLLLPTASPGIHIAADAMQLGLRAAPLATLTADGCRLPSGHVLARGPQVRRALRAGLEGELLILTARAVGVARAAFEYATQYAVQRSAFGRPIAEHQAVAFMVADMGTDVDAARALLWQAAWAVDANDDERSAAVEAASMFAFERVVSVASDAVQILGGHGYIQDHPVEKWMRDGRTLANCGAAASDLWRSCDVQP